AAVVTGQQVGLFLGPLYTIYKAATAVVVARVLAAETGSPVVPVFWLQTEDHDLVEIASCSVPGVGACETIAAPIAAENRISIAHHRLPAEIAGCLDQLEDALGDGSLAQAHLERLRRHYRPGVPWSAAFAGVLAALLAALRDEPRRFSTSALLRPIVQDTLLPTVAYVGGPSEVAYFAQLGPLYRAFDRTPPLVVPRARFRITDGRTRRLLDRLGL